MGEDIFLIMSLKTLFGLALLALASARDFNCNDYTFKECRDPVANQELHVNTLQEGIENCDLFGAFDQCDYLLYYSKGNGEFIRRRRNEQLPGRLQNIRTPSNCHRNRWNEWKTNSMVSFGQQ